MNATQQEITKLRSLQESFDEMSSKIDLFVSAALKKLTDELKAIVTNKNYILA